MNPLTIFELAGDEVAMGRQHGELTRELGGWEETLPFYAGLPARLLGAGRRDRGRGVVIAALTRLLGAGLARLDAARPAMLRDRTEAFVTALGRPAEERRNLLVLDAAQNAVGLLGRWGLTHDAGRLAQPGACSTFAVWGDASEDGRLLHARNFDLPGIGVWERAPSVVFCTPGRGLRYGFVATRGADVPGVTAFNEAGISVTAHTRFHREVTFDGAGIVDLGHRIAREARSLTEAVAIASERRSASTWALVVSSARERRAISIELHAGRSAVAMPLAGETFLAVTNRYRVPVMQRGELAPSAAWVRYSDGREAAMQRRLRAIAASGVGPGRGLGVEDAMALLGSHEAGDVPGWERATGDCLAQSISVQSVVIDPEREVVWVGTGSAPTSAGPWVAVPWRWGERRAVRVIEAPTADGPRASWSRGPRAVGFAHFMEAARLESVRADEAAVEVAIEAAVRAEPEDPSYRHLAGGIALRSGRFDEALAHLEGALEAERSPFRRSQLEGWAGLARRWAGKRAGSARGPRPDALRDLPARRHRELGVDFQLLAIMPP